jgi:hypothetical protein
MTAVKYKVTTRRWNAPMTEDELDAVGDGGWQLITVVKLGDRDTELQYIFSR